MTNIIPTLEDIKQVGRDCSAVEWINGVESVIHVIRVPDCGQKGCYHSSISMSYYRERELTNWHDNFYTKRKTCPRWFNIKQSYEPICDFVQQQENILSDITEKPWHHPIRNCPIIEHDSIWDFYKYINYDYKKKKYI